jgi:hypothetical protein
MVRSVVIITDNCIVSAECSNIDPDLLHYKEVNDMREDYECLLARHEYHKAIDTFLLADEFKISGETSSRSTVTPYAVVILFVRPALQSIELDISQSEVHAFSHSVIIICI